MELKSTLYSFDNKEYQCGWCLKKYRGRQDYEQITKANRTRKGCFGVSPNALHKFDDLEYSTCVGNSVSESALFWIEAEARYNQGILPYPGSLSEQPAKVLEIFGCIAVHKQDKLEKQRKAQELKERAIGRSRNSHTPHSRR